MNATKAIKQDTALVKEQKPILAQKRPLKIGRGEARGRPSWEGALKKRPNNLPIILGSLKDEQLLYVFV